MTTFAAPQPLTAQITAALKRLRQARFDGDYCSIAVAERNLDRLLDRLPRSTAQE